MTDELVYPSVELILDLHEQIVAEGDTTEPGVRSKAVIASAVGTFRRGSSERCPRRSTKKRSI